MLLDLDHELDAEQVSMVFAEMKDPVRRKIERYGLARQIGPESFYPTIGTAVSAFREKTGAQWTSPSHEPHGSVAFDKKTDDTSPPQDLPASPPGG